MATEGGGRDHRGPKARQYREGAWPRWASAMATEGGGAAEIGRWHGQVCVGGVAYAGRGRGLDEEEAGPQRPHGFPLQERLGGAAPP